MAVSKNKNELRGIGGWLILFIIFIAYQIYGYLSGAILFIFKWPSNSFLTELGYNIFENNVLFNSIMHVICLALFVYLLILVIRKSDNTLKIAFLALWVSFVYDSISMFLFFGTYIGIIFTLLFSIPAIVWTLYILYSKRVAFTFRESGPSKSQIARINSPNKTKIIVWSIVISIIIILFSIVFGVIQIINLGKDVYTTIDSLDDQLKGKNIDQAISICNSNTGLLSQLKKDSCLLILAMQYSNESGYEDAKLCINISSKEMKDKCILYTGIGSNDPSACYKLEDKDQEIICRAYVLRDKKECLNLSNKILFDACTSGLIEFEKSDMKRKFHAKFIINSTKDNLDGEVLIYGKSLGFTNNGSLYIQRNEIENISSIFFKTNYSGQTVILPYDFNQSDLNREGMIYLASEEELSEDTFGLDEESILDPIE